MTQGSKTAIWIVVIIVVLGLIWWVYAAGRNPNYGVQGDENYGNVTPTSIYSSTTTTETTISTSSSNSDLNQDLNKVDTQLNGLNQDNTSASQSVSGQY